MSSVKLSHTLAPSRILASLHAKNRWEAIDELVDAMVKDNTVLPEKRRDVIDALVAREQSMSTGIGFGVAIPHASTNGIGQVALAVGVSKGGVDFEALDGKPVHIVALFLVPSGEYQNHLKTLAFLSRLLNEKGFRKDLEKSKTPEEIYAVFKKRHDG
ncbi:MAG: PTS sugar transporter subunit IIA [Verrucomicrobiae bacterium]|nr:PTS sugar transporter subunit IIA [Verrucomicrobiae bacterium]